MISVRGVVIDIGGVLAHDRLLDTASRWAGRLALSPEEMLAALYGGNDDTVLVGRVSEDDWWEVVRGRLGTDTSALRAELESGQTWHEELVAVLRAVKSAARTAILSNAWPSQRSRMAELKLTDVVHELLLSCEIGCAKPSPKAFKVALQRLGTAPEETLSSTTRPVTLRPPQDSGSAGTFTRPLRTPSMSSAFHCPWPEITSTAGSVHPGTHQITTVTRTGTRDVTLFQERCERRPLPIASMPATPH